MIGTAEQDEFVRDHIYAVATTLRKDGSPTNSVVYCVCDADELIFSTTADRLKAQTLDGDPRIALTILDDGAPHRYVTVEGTATVQRDNVVPPHVQIVKAMRGEDWEPPANYAERLAEEGRVIIRISPSRVSGSVNR